MTILQAVLLFLQCILPDTVCHTTHTHERRDSGTVHCVCVCNNIVSNDIQSHLSYSRFLIFPVVYRNPSNCCPYASCNMYLKPMHSSSNMRWKSAETIKHSRRTTEDVVNCTHQDFLHFQLKNTTAFSCAFTNLGELTYSIDLHQT